MSGLIGGAGSKSGVIGTTELDYEEGTFTVTAGSNSLDAGLVNLNYVKFGKLCWVSGSIRVSSGGHDMLISTLPFTCQGDPASGSGNAWGSLEIYRADVVSDTLYCQVSINSSTAVLRFNQVKDDTDTVLITGESTAYYGITITYKIA